MMHTFIGNLTADPTTHNTPDGRTSIHLRIAVSERYRDSRTGEWKSKEPTFWDAYAWNAKAEAIAAQQWRKGTPVIIVGELVANVWTDQETGHRTGRPPGPGMECTAARTAAAPGCKLAGRWRC